MSGIYVYSTKILEEFKLLTPLPRRVPRSRGKIYRKNIAQIFEETVAFFFLFMHS